MLHSTIRWLASQKKKQACLLFALLCFFFYNIDAPFLLLVTGYRLFLLNLKLPPFHLETQTAAQRPPLSPNMVIEEFYYKIANGLALFAW